VLVGAGANAGGGQRGGYHESVVALNLISLTLVGLIKASAVRNAQTPSAGRKRALLSALPKELDLLDDALIRLNFSLAFPTVRGWDYHGALTIRSRQPDD